MFTKVKQFFCSHYKNCERIGNEQLNGFILGDNNSYTQKLRCKNCKKEFETIRKTKYGY